MTAMKAKSMIIHWLPRILCILAIAFIELFAMDSFDPKLTFREQMIGFFMHSLPAVVLVIFLVIAWKWELAGGILFILTGAGFSPLIYTMNYRMNHSVWMSMSIILMITFPFIVTGVLFVICHFLKKKSHAGTISEMT
jgi:hypothetical protein